MFARFMRDPRALRRLAIGTMATTALYAAVVGFHLAGQTVTTWIDDFGLAAAAALAGFASIFVARRRKDRSRLVWTLVGAACLSWSAGELAAAVFEITQHRELPFPSIVDGLYLLGTLFAIAGVAFLVPRNEHISGLIRRLLDGCILGTSLLLVSWVIVLKDVVRSSNGGPFALGIALAYPIGDVITIAVVISIATHTRNKRRQALMLLAAGMMLQALTDTLFVDLAAHGSYTGGFIDTGWFLGYLLIGLAALRKATVNEDEPTLPSHPKIANVLVPFAAAVGSMGLAIVQEMRGHDDRFLFWCGSVIIAIVLVRLMLTIADNISLTRSLESRVDERTAELGSRERLFRSLVQNSSDVITVLDRDGVIVSMSGSARSILNLEPAAVIGARGVELIHPDDFARFRAAFIQSTTRPHGSFTPVEFRVRRGGGSWISLEATITNLLQDPDVHGLVLNSRDVSERKGLEAELTRQAFHDSLTGLANRVLFQERIEHALARRDRLDRPLAVLYADLDGFKSVNDMYGHETGDELLRQVSERIRTCTRPGDTVARLGGDEFGILMESLDDSAAAIRLAERCAASMREPFKVGERRIFSDISIGIAVTNALETADEILRNADVAMYEIKARGGGGYQLFDPGLHATVLRRVELGRDLRGALERHELFLRYQPVYSLRDGRLEGAEALIRWNHPVWGEIDPAQFIAIAEETGLIVPIGEWVLKHATTMLGSWDAIAGAGSALSMAVNISARQLQEHDFPERVRQILSETKVDPTRVVLEITESGLMQDTTETIVLLRTLKSLGVQLAIDDFGTGYSSLSYLRRLPTDILKIDRSFVKSVDKGPEDSALTRAIVKLAGTFGLRTIAEGIERPEQAAVLSDMGCDSVQGYLYARPLLQEEFEALVSPRSIAETQRVGA